MFKQKIEGEICGDCGKAKYVKSPKSGKIFCADKCWLVGGTPQPAPQTSVQKFEKDLDKDIADGVKREQEKQAQETYDHKKMEEVIGMIRTNLTGQWLASGRNLDAKAFVQIDLGVRYAYGGMKVVPALLKEGAGPVKPLEQKVAESKLMNPPAQAVISAKTPTQKGDDVWNEIVGARGENE